MAASRGHHLLVVLHFLVWLCRPIHEWQSWLHVMQTWVEVGWSAELNLRAALFFFVVLLRSSSACLMPCLAAALQGMRESATLSQDCTLIPALFRSRLQMSLKRSFGRRNCDFMFWLEVKITLLIDILSTLFSNQFFSLEGDT